MKLSKILLVFVFALPVVMAFQNCGRASNPLLLSTDLSKSDGGSTQTYDGKIYILLGSPCPDHSEVQSKLILTSASSGYLIRKDCQDITPVGLTSYDFQLNADNLDQVIYLSQTLSASLPSTDGITNFKASRDGTEVTFSYTYTGSPTFLHLYLDTDESTATGFPFLGLGADYLVENDVLWKYSVSSASADDTWPWIRVSDAKVFINGSTVQWTIPVSEIGFPAALKAIADTSNGFHTEISTF